MFPSRTVMRFFSPCTERVVAPLNRKRGFVCAALVGCACCLASSAIAADSAGEGSQSNASSRSDSDSKLVLGVRWSNPACAERLQQRTKAALAVLALLGDFDCRLSSEALSFARPGNLVVDGPFQDTLLNIPVHGQAHVEGTLTVVPAADDQHAAVDVHVDGIARLTGAGTSYRVQIESDATVKFHAVKRVLFDTAGATSLPTTCTAETDMIFKEITAKQPKLLGKFAERVAQRKIADSHEAAEAECSEHVIEAICAAFDRELGNSTTIVNATLNEFLAAASEAHRAQWQQVRFRTATDSVWISRDTDETSQFAKVTNNLGTALPTMVLQIPRNSIGLKHLLAGVQLMQPQGEKPSTDTPTATSVPQMRTSVSWQEKIVTLTIDYERAVGLAHEPVVGAAQ
jgi:hypothetical protein